MLISILLILSFQIYYGYVYHYIGILTSLFMLGSALGAFIAMKRIKTSLTTVETGILFLTGFLYLFILLSPEAGISQLIIFGSMVTIGFLTGMEYPLAVNLADSLYKAVSSTAGRFYALDLFGAFLGAILTAVFIPTIGIKNTLIITMAIKSGSLLLVYMGKPRTTALQP
jgi:spermidine synthase